MLSFLLSLVLLLFLFLVLQLELLLAFSLVLLLMEPRLISFEHLLLQQRQLQRRQLSQPFAILEQLSSHLQPISFQQRPFLWLLSFLLLPSFSYRLEFLSILLASQLMEPILIFLILVLQLEHLQFFYLSL